MWLALNGLKHAKPLVWCLKATSQLNWLITTTQQKEVSGELELKDEALDLRGKRHSGFGLWSQRQVRQSYPFDARLWQTVNKHVAFIMYSCRVLSHNAIHSFRFKTKPFNWSCCFKCTSPLSPALFLHKDKSKTVRRHLTSKTPDETKDRNASSPNSRIQHWGLGTFHLDWRNERKDRNTSEKLYNNTGCRACREWRWGRYSNTFNHLASWV